jgi:hypothetical protein
MRLETAIVLPCLVAGAVAEPHKIVGSVSKFEAEELTDSMQWTGKIYDNCQQYHGDKFISRGWPCVSELLKTTLAALTIVGHVDEGVRLVNNEAGFEANSNPETDFTPTPSMLITKPSQSADSESYGAKFERGDGVENDILLRGINDHNRKHSNAAHMVRAVQVEHSMVHPRHGISVRTNVHNDDTTLHVHTNGSRAIATFEKTSSSQMNRRDEVAAQEMDFKFGTMQGIKMQIDWSSDDQQKRYVSSSDLEFFTTAFGHGDGVTDPAFMKSDSWRFVVCNIVDNTKVLQGKLISLVSATDTSFEKDDDDMACV